MKIWKLGSKSEKLVWLFNIVIDVINWWLDLIPDGIVEKIVISSSNMQRKEDVLSP